MGQPARSEEKEQKTFRTTQPLKWSNLVLARALVGALFSLVKNELNRAVSINDSGIRNAPLLSPKRLFTILRSSASTTISLLNKPQELRLIVVAFVLSLSFLLALTAFIAPYSSRELFTELKELQPISNDSCAPIVNISRSSTLISSRVSTPSTKEPFKRLLKTQLGSPNFGTSAASRTTFQPQISDLYCGESHIGCYHFSSATSSQAQPQKQPLKYENHL